jgi:hypothetical protein
MASPTAILRSLVSKKKKRYKDDKFDLDLSCMYMMMMMATRVSAAEQACWLSPSSSRLFIKT